ncbi:Putative transmembrane protein [Burkholderia cenocepacia]|uniref:LysE family translocator n=1 Tax=Burkholderia cenocepacia TaxID=95486 RepID=UPI000F5B7C2C|nr:LysE family translocator [Burkholderia cenocepacia]RQU83684.1 LysE family translocator [Burkholderia cenocepacia]CAD9223296.1 Putative transmembrane protein [Burkholderia cenocepacia]
MPIQEALLKMSMYVSLVLIVPGPTNTLLLSSGLKVGLRGTWPLVVAEALGYAIAIAGWGFFLSAFAAGRPWLYDVVKLASSVYILFLALKMWTHSRVLQDVSIAPVSFRDVFIATMMNPKALLFSSTLFPLEAFRSAHYFAWALLVFLVVLAPIGVGWSSLGGLLTSRRAWAARTSALLRGASLVLLMFSGTLVYSVVNR